MPETNQHIVIDIDPCSGFCFGVVNAIEKAEQSLSSGERVCCLGDIVHNREEVARLESLGMRTISHGEIHSLGDAVMLVRAHGEPPSTFAMARENAVRVIDATCPVVARLQKIVVEAHALMQRCNGTVVVLGKKGHPEVVGLAGQVGGEVTVIEDTGDLDTLDYSMPVYLLSQTTQSLELFAQVERMIRERIKDPEKLTVNDTICRQVSNREKHLRAFASEYEAVVFVSGRKSSNGRILYGVCRDANPCTYMAENVNDLEPAWFAGRHRIGVCGATSTPKWLMHEIAREIRKLLDDEQ